MRVDPRFAPAVCAQEVIEGQLLGVTVGDVDVLLVRIDGQVRAMGRICTHQYADLAEGTIENRCVVCPLHGSKFDIVTGAPLTLPAIEAEPIYEVFVENGIIYVDVNV